MIADGLESDHAKIFPSREGSALLQGFYYLYESRQLNLNQALSRNIWLYIIFIYSIGSITDCNGDRNGGQQHSLLLLHMFKKMKYASPILAILYYSNLVYVIGKKFQSDPQLLGRILDYLKSTGFAGMVKRRAHSVGR